MLRIGYVKDRLPYSFFNSKDTVLLASFAVSSWTLVRLLEKRSPSRAAAHGLACAITVDLRLVGLLLPIVTLLLLGTEWVRGGRSRGLLRRVGAIAGVYASSLTAFAVLLWPQLWHAPAGQLLAALGRVGRARQGANAFALFRGEFVPVDALPWHYLPTWMALTLSPFVVALFAVGLPVVVYGLWRRPLWAEANRWPLLFLALLLLPLAAVAILRPVLYDGWRHFYFVTPALLTVGLLGARDLVVARPRLRPALAALLALGVAHGLYAVARDHPHQHVYFNGLAPADLERAFELDYWGLSFRDGLEQVLALEPEGAVQVAVSDSPGALNAWILPKDQRDRLHFVPGPQARYFLSNHRQPEHHRRFLAGEPPYDRPVHFVRAGNARLLGVYDLR